MIGYVMIDAAALIAIRDALVNNEVDEAYHILRVQADPDFRHSLAAGNSWLQWEEIAKHSPTV